MTTAHRPTWQAAKGGEEQGGMRIYAASHMTSAKDQISQTKMKFRYHVAHLPVRQEARVYDIL